MKKLQFPCTTVQLLPAHKVRANHYNPNHVANPEMKLLIESIEQDGVTMPIVVGYDPEDDMYTVIDGFHRYTVLTKHFKSEVIPAVVLKKNMAERMAATIRHNRARGKHDVELTAVIVARLREEGKKPHEIAIALGMSSEELIRLTQTRKITDFYKDGDFTPSWERTDGGDDEDEYTSETIEEDEQG